MNGKWNNKIHKYLAGLALTGLVLSLCLGSGGAPVVRAQAAWTDTPPGTSEVTSLPTDLPNATPVPTETVVPTEPSGTPVQPIHLSEPPRMGMPGMPPIQSSSAIPTKPGVPDYPFWPSGGNMPAQNNAGASVSPETLTLGTPGLSFRYVQTFGELEKGILEDNSHFDDVQGLTTDGTNLWLTDSWNNRVVKFDSSGTFLQKIGQATYIDSTGTALNYISDVAVDSGGNVWVVDSGADHVVKYDASGTRQSELGQAWNGGAGNNQFHDPISIAFDTTGNIYVSDSGIWYNGGNQRIQIFDSTGAYLNTIGVTGATGSDDSHFNYPRGIAIYADTLYVADANNQRVQIFDVSDPLAPSHVATLGTVGVSGTDSSHFSQPEGVGVSSNYIYVADSNNNRIQVFNRTSRAYVTTFGSAGTGSNQFNHPSDISIDTSGNIYVADNYNDRVQKFNSSRVYQATRGTTGVPYLTDNYHYNQPAGVAVSADGSIFILENRGQRLVKLNAAGTAQWTVGYPGQNGSDNGHFFWPADVAVDGSGNVYVADGDNNRVQKFTAAGAWSATLGTGWGTGTTQFENPTGIAVDKNGNIYVADSQNQRVQIFSASLAYVTSLGLTGAPGSDKTHFNNPQDVAVDANGFIYVADTNNQRVQVFNASRVYDHTLGLTGVSGGDFAHFGQPQRLAVDSSNRLYVSDPWNNRIQVFDSTGAYLTTVGGAWGTASNQFTGPVGVAIGPDGALYVADQTDNNRIQKFALGTPGWVQTNLNGFGDLANNGIWSLNTLNDQMYAGTADTNGAQIWRSADGKSWSQFTPSWTAANDTVLDMGVFGSYLYAGTDNAAGGEIWRTNGSSWSQVVIGGFGDSNNYAIDSFVVFSDVLYAATSTTNGIFQIYSSTTGDLNSWEPVVSDGFGSNGVAQDVKLFVFGNYLYIGLGRNGVAELWRTDDGTTWSPVFTNGLAANNTHVSALADFGGTLYIGLRNVTTGGEIWSSTDGTTFNLVFNGGLGNANDGRPYGLIVNNGYLYLIFSNPATGAEVWRSADGTTWTKIGNAGWGDSNNTQADYFDKVATLFNNNLFIGTMNAANGGEIWQLLHQIFLPLVRR